MKRTHLGCTLLLGVMAMSLFRPALGAAPVRFGADQLTDPARQVELARHFRTRPAIDLDPILFADAFADERWWKVAKRDEPDKVLEHDFAFYGCRRTFPADIDWNGMIDDDRETTWSLNRFNFLMVLQEADEGQDDPKYARKGIELMLDWVGKCPVGKAKDLWGPWRPLEIGLRLATWTRFLDYVARTERIEPAELGILLNSLREQCDYLASVTGPGRGNHGFMENSGLGMAALVFGELAGSSDWLATACKNLSIGVDNQVYPDGSHQEMSPVYEFTCLFSVARVAYLAVQRGKPVPANLVTGLRNMNRYLAFIQKTDGTLPAFNDGDRFDLNKLLAFLARWQKQADVLWVATRGKEGAKPASAHFFAPYSGLAIFRTGWDRQAQTLLLDAGPFGTSHQHNDALQIEFSAFGEDFLVEPGRFTYRDDPIRHYLLSTRAHSTITVDGGEQRSRQFPDIWRSKQPIDAGFTANDGFGFARGVYRLGYKAEGAEKITHRRSVFFVPGRYAVVYDLIEGQGEHEVALHWSFAPVIVAKKDAATIIAQAMDRPSEDGKPSSSPLPSLVLNTAGPAEFETKIAFGQENPAAGWYSEVYGVKHPAPHVTMTAKVALPARFATVLCPFRGNTLPEPAIALDPAGDERVIVTLNGRSEKLSPKGIE